MPETVEQKLKRYIDRFANDSAQALCAALGPMLTEGELSRLWMAERLADMADERPNLPAGYADPACQSLVMLDHGLVHLSLAMISAEGWNAQRNASRALPDIIGFADGWTAIRFLVADGARIQRHRLEHSNGKWRAYPQSPEDIESGHFLRLNNAVETLRFVKVNADIVMQRLLVRDPDVGHAYECDAATGEVLRVRQAQSHQGRTQMMVSLLRSLGRRDAVPVIAKAMTSWPAHLRWHGVREALATDSVAGFVLLEAMAQTDPDEPLRMFAKTTRDDLVARYPQLAA